MHHLSFLRLQCLLILVLLLLSVPDTGAAVDGGEFIYDGFSGNDLTMDGEASVVDGLLQLTSGQELSEGHAFYTYPINLTSGVVPNSSIVPSFSTTFVFAIIGPYLDLGGHGLAFVLSSTKELFSALPAQYLGLLNNEWNYGNVTNRLLAIEIDTIQNTEFRDIDDNHIGIDINNLVSLASHTAGYYTPDGEFHPLSLISRKPMQVWVDYDSNLTVLNVTIAPYYLSSTKPSRPLLSLTWNLSLVLPTTTVYAGFSSGNGRVNSKHYILGWSFKLNGEAAALDYSALSVKAIQELAQQVDDRSHRYKTIRLCIILLPSVAISVLVSALLVKVLLKRQLEARKAELEWQKEYGPPSFTYKDLLAATSGFKDKMLLGRGGFGSVYKGLLPHSKQTVAIKRVSPESKQGMKEFMAEIIILGHLRHRNLVQLLGYCRHKQQLLLVYDYMPNGSLDCYLHCQEKHPNVCWDQRFNIIKGIASGLFYLHEDWEQVVIHRDIKTSNVLLDSEMNARLGDFGLARSHAHGADAHTTHVAGTWGYIAPELARLGKATKATDVFAFGVLMMEVACARRPIIWANGAEGEPLALADWVLAAWRRGSITDAIDPRLDDYVEEETELVLKLGLLCSHPSPNARPRMRLVMQYLERDASLPADLQPDTLLSTFDVSQDEIMHEQHAMSCPTTAITDLSRGR
ncbi:unnamed protein product [Urochloa decumbens]|uniref:non-specific serine/threonine protein kinase n=1 Tax=Urochloa decumbens TaxID=240449 RepID=A0ABC9H831_9POAL